MAGDKIVNWLYDWRTLVAGILALAAAVVASWVAHHVGQTQVRALEKQIKEIKGSERRALAHEAKRSYGLIGGVLNSSAEKRPRSGGATGNATCALPNIQYFPPDQLADGTPIDHHIACK